MCKYMCLLAPKVYIVLNQNDSFKAADEIQKMINEQALHGWEFYSMEEISTKTQDGCLASLSPGFKQPEVIHNMLIFRREKEVNSTDKGSAWECPKCGRINHGEKCMCGEGRNERERMEQLAISKLRTYKEKLDLGLITIEEYNYQKDVLFRDIQPENYE